MKTVTHHLHRALGFGALLLCASPLMGQHLVGQWDFNNSDLTATVGLDLTYADGPGGITQQGTHFGTTTSLGVPDIGGTAANVMQFPAATNGAGYFMIAPPTANGGGSLVNEWSLVMDVLYPTGSNAKIRPIIDTDGNATVAGPEFVVDSTGGIGSPPLGPYYGAVGVGAWYRLGISVNNAESHIYINGAKVGDLPAYSSDGRYSMSPSLPTLILGDTGTNAAPGYLNSLQIWDVALSPGQMAALGAPSASGIPTNIPPIPSYLQSWTPSGEATSTTTDLGAVINPGDASITTSSIALKLDGVAQTGVQISSNNLITVLKSAAGPLTAGRTYTLELSYTDSLSGQKSFSKQFRAALLYEDFEELALGTNVDEAPGTVLTNVWTKTPPAGWSIDDSGVPGVGDPTQDGVTEWAGWSFAKNTFWGVVTDNQDRQLFTLGKGTVAVADNDEWDDAAHPRTNYYSTLLYTRPINIAGVAPGSIFMKFDSSWRPEGHDDWDELGRTNDQTARITVSYDGKPPVEVLHWSSISSNPGYHPDNQNEKVSLLLSNPTATNMVVCIAELYAANDWWWAFDNLEINVGDVPSSIDVYTPGAGATGVGPQPSIGAIVNPGTTTLNPASVQVLLDGTSLPVTVTTNAQSRIVISSRAAAVLPQLSTHTNTLVYSDSLKGLQTNTWSFTVGNYDQITLGTPVWLEDFNGVAEASFPTGWLATNRTSVLSTNFDLNDPESAAYENWVVVSTNRLGAVFNGIRFNVRPTTLNGQAVEALMSGNLAYGESDNRGGSQVQVLFSPVINLSGITGVQLGFNSIYEQNQDSSGAVEYSIDGGATWLPALYMVAQADVVVGDPVSTLGTARGDQAWGESYGAFIGATTVDASFDPFISPRIDDDPVESKRIEVLRLTQADNKANVRLRFTHTGTGSWYFGIDDVGLYGTGGTAVAPAIANQPQSQTVAAGSAVTLRVGLNPTTARPVTYKWQKNNVDVPGATNQILTINSVQAGDAGAYKVIITNGAGSTTSDVATISLSGGTQVSIGFSISGSNLVLTWAGAPTVSLQSTPSFSPVNWQTVPNTLGASTATIPLTGTASFFRLVSQ